MLFKKFIICELLLPNLGSLSLVNLNVALLRLLICNNIKIITPARCFFENHQVQITDVTKRIYPTSIPCRFYMIALRKYC